MLKNWINQAINYWVKSQTQKAFESYVRYPVDKTAIILIDVDQVFMNDDANFTKQLQQFLTFSRTQGYLHIYSRFDVNADIPFKSGAHEKMLSALSKREQGEDIYSAAIAPQTHDVELAARSGLSVFYRSDLLRHLKASNIEHLLLLGPLSTLSVDSSIRDAAQEDFHLSVLSDCFGQIDSEASQTELDFILPRYVHSILSVDDFKEVALQTPQA